MPRLAAVPFQDSIAHTLGLLYERKARGAALIRVLEEYRRFSNLDKSSSDRTSVGTISGENADRSQRKLEHLYLRRAAVDELIRSIEEYTHCRRMGSARNRQVTSLKNN